MITCAHCHAVLSGDETTDGLCPGCGRPLPLVDPLTVDEISATIDPAMTMESHTDLPSDDSGKKPRTHGFGDATIDLSQTAESGTDFELNLSQPDRPQTRGFADATIDLDASQFPRSMSVAPRNLSMGDLAKLTQTWDKAMQGVANPRQTMKMESKSSPSSSMGSSLVVNPRGLREPQAITTDKSGTDYEILSVIGKGGMGVVYSARQTSVDRLVAVKMIKAKAAKNPAVREKFLSEAVVTGDLDHPNIVPIYELGANEEGSLFYSMKRVQGTAWSDLVGTKPLPDNLEILVKVADAVAFAHANGVVHRDLKPENVMLGDFGEVLVMDWGLAMACPTFRHSEFVSTPDSMGGTPAYMAPEMVTGPFEQLGPACDIYLLGAILFEIVTGGAPHAGTSLEKVLFAAARNDIAPTTVTGELIDIAYRAMATAPADRYATVQDFQAAIREYNSHCQSTLLSSRARQELILAEQSHEYPVYARALFGFQEALELWSGNHEAAVGVVETKKEYAQCARDKGDFELGLSLLDATEPSHAEIRAALQESLRQREARAQWHKRLTRLAAGLVATIFAVICVALYIVNSAKQRESEAHQKEAEQRQIAEQERNAAVDAKQAEEVAKQDALKQKDIAEAARATAVEEEQKAILAKQGEEYESYLARIGVAAAKIEENSFDAARAQLAACIPQTGQLDLRGWEWGYLEHRAAQRDTMQSVGAVRAVAIAPHGEWLITGGDDKKAHYWNLETSAEILPAVEGTAAVNSAVVSDDGKTVAIGFADGKVQLLRAADHEVLRELNAHPRHHVLHLEFSPNGASELATCSDDGAIRLWNTSSGQEVAGSPLQGHYGSVYSVAYSPDGKKLVSAGNDRKVIVWQRGESLTAPFQVSKVFLEHAGPVFAARFSPDGKQIASAGYDKQILLWNPETLPSVDLGQLIAGSESSSPPVQTLRGHSGPVRSLSFAANGLLCSGSDDNTIRVWNLTQGTQMVLRGHSRPVMQCAVTADAVRVASGDQDGFIKLWNLRDYAASRIPEGLSLGSQQDALLGGAFSPDGKQVVLASRDGTAAIYETSTGQLTHTLEEGHSFLAGRAVLLLGGTQLATAAGDGSVRIWDTKNGNQLCDIHGTGRTLALAVSADSRWLLTGCAAATQDAEPEQQPCKLALWQLRADGREAVRKELSPTFGTGHRAAVSALAVSPDGKLLFSGDEAGHGRVWNAETGEPVYELRNHVRAITDAQFLPHGKVLLTASADGTVARWDLSTGKEVSPALAHADDKKRDAFDTAVTGLAVSPDGSQIATIAVDSANGTRESVVRLWDLAAAQPPQILFRSSESVTSVAYSADGKHLIVASYERQENADQTTRTINRVHRFEVSSGGEQFSAGGGAAFRLASRRDPIWQALDAGEAGLVTVAGNGADLWNWDEPALPVRSYRPHAAVNAVAYSPDGKWIVTGGTDRRLKIWNATTGEGAYQLPTAHTGAIRSVGFSPTSENVMLSSGDDGVVRLWDMAKRVVRFELRHFSADDKAAAGAVAAFTPDGSAVISVGGDGRICSWNVANGARHWEETLSGAALSVAVSPDGKCVFIGLQDGAALLMDLLTHQPVAKFLGHTAGIDAVSFSPDGRRLVSASSDRLTKVWDSRVPAATQTGEMPLGKEVLTLRRHARTVTAAVFSPQGGSLLSCGLDGEAILWSADTMHKE